MAMRTWLLSLLLASPSMYETMGLELHVAQPGEHPPGAHHSLAAARDAIRVARQRARRANTEDQAAASRAIVHVHAGRYELAGPLVLGPQDSFTSWVRADASAPRPVHSGGRRLEGTWSSPSEPGEPWKLHLSGPMATVGFKQLWVDGQRAVRAREPELGSFFQYVGLLAANPGRGFIYRGYNSTSEQTLSALEGNEQGLEIVVYASWMAARRNVESINATSRSVVLTAGARISLEPYANSGSRFYVENFAAACDSAGEWFLDTADGGSTLLWHPRKAGEDPRTLEFVAPYIEGELLLLDGAVEVTVEGQSFQHADWSMFPTNVSSGGCQAASFLNHSAVHLHNASNCVLENVTVERVGQYGIWLEKNSANNKITGSLTYDTGAGGVRVGTGKPLAPGGDHSSPDGSDGNTIVNSTFAWGSHVFHEGQGVLAQKVSRTVIANNEVAYFQTGISVGWTWDYRPSEANHNLVLRNHVHHFGNGELSDLAAIYLLGISPGTVVKGNWAHDAYPYYSFGHGIYLDQATAGVVVEGNLAYHTEGATLYQHYGTRNVVRNNIIALATGGIGQVWQHANGMAPGDEISDIELSSNLIYVDRRAGWQGLFGNQWLGNSTFVKNLYYNASSDGAIVPSWPAWQNGTHCNGWRNFSAHMTCGFPDVPQVPNRTWSEWQETGQDVGSLIANPLFVSPNPVKPRDFRLAPDSPARKVGFDPGIVTAVADPADVGPPPEHTHEWSPAGLGCPSSSAAPCATPEPPVNGSVSGNGVWRCGDLAVWHCRPGFQLTGATFAYCTAAGWTSPAPQCVSLPIPAPPECLATFGGWDGESSSLSTSGPSSMLSPNGQHTLDLQVDGNLCIYTLSSGSPQGPATWCSGNHAVHPAGPFKTVMQSDGNLCTYPGTVESDRAQAYASGKKEYVGERNRAEVWCSGTAHANCTKPPCAYWAALRDDGRLCVYEGMRCEPKAAPADSAAWCSGQNSVLADAAPVETAFEGRNSPPAPLAAHNWDTVALRRVESVRVFHAKTDDVIDTLALRPPMGWSSWKGFHFFTTETDVMAAAEALATNGMATVGYRLVSIDGGWWGGGWSGKVRRNETGFFTVNDTKFPSGMPALSKYVTSRGLGFGAYTAANDVMCSKDLGGSMNHEGQDVALFVEDWNISAVKVDDCGAKNASAIIARWHQLLNASGKHVLLFNSQVGCCSSRSGACSAGFKNVMPAWCYAQPGTMYQPDDGNDVWDVIIERHASIKGRTHLARPGHWLDPGFLTLDMGDLYFDHTQTSLDLNQAVFALWCVVSAPLVASVSFSGRYCPMGAFGHGVQPCRASRPAPEAILDILRNKKAISVNQLWAGFAGDVYSVELTQKALTIAPDGENANSHHSTGPVANLFLSKCDANKPSQVWEINSTAAVTNVRSSQATGEGGCWDIYGCQTGSAPVTAGHCKPLPTPGSGCHAGTSQLCGCSGAWKFNHTTGSTPKTVLITSVMDGACLQADRNSNIVGGLCSTEAEFSLVPVSSSEGQTEGFRVSTVEGDLCVDSTNAWPPVPPPTPASLPELWGKPLPSGAAFVIFRNDPLSSVAELNLSFALRDLPSSLNFNISSASEQVSCVLSDIWGAKSKHVVIGRAIQVTLRRRQTFFFTVENCCTDEMVAAPLRPAAPRLVFEPPLLLGLNEAFGIQASLSFSDTAFAAYLGAGKVALSTDAGTSFGLSTYPPGFTVPEWPVVVDHHAPAGMWQAHDFGNISSLHHEKTNMPTWFNFTVQTVDTFEFETGKLKWKQAPKPAFFGGLPYGVGGELYVRGLRLQGGGQVTLSDGSLLHTGSVWFPQCSPPCWNGSTVRAQPLKSFKLLPNAQLGGHFLAQGNFSLVAAETKCSADPKCTGFCFPVAEPGGMMGPEGVRHLFFKGSTRSFSSPGWNTFRKAGAAPPPLPGPPVPPGHKSNCCPGNAASTHGTSAVAFRSLDGFNFHYLSTIMDARSIPESEEGCAEMDLIKLRNGHIVMICRTDAGDGEETHKSSNYARSLSTDEGRTWGTPRYVNAGCARPRLLATTAPSGDEVLLMAGGRWGSPGNYANNCRHLPCDWKKANRSMEPTLFFDGSGSEGLSWTPHSISYLHNLLLDGPAGNDVPKDARFTTRVNETWEESTAYTSLVTCGRGCAVLFYDLAARGANVFQKNATKYAFAMRIRVTADGELTHPKANNEDTTGPNCQKGIDHSNGLGS